MSSGILCSGEMVRESLEMRNRGEIEKIKGIRADLEMLRSDVAEIKAFLMNSPNTVKNLQGNLHASAVGVETGTFGQNIQNLQASLPTVSQTQVSTPLLVDPQMAAGSYLPIYSSTVRVSFQPNFRAEGGLGTNGNCGQLPPPFLPTQNSPMLGGPNLYQQIRLGTGGYNMQVPMYQHPIFSQNLGSGGVYPGGMPFQTNQYPGIQILDAQRNMYMRDVSHSQQRYPFMQSGSGGSSQQVPMHLHPALSQPFHQEVTQGGGGMSQSMHYPRVQLCDAQRNLYWGEKATIARRAHSAEVGSQAKIQNNNQRTVMLKEPVADGVDTQKGSTQDRRLKPCCHCKEPWLLGHQLNCKVRKTIHTIILKEKEGESKIEKIEEPPKIGFVKAPGSSNPNEGADSGDHLMYLSAYLAKGTSGPITFSLLTKIGRYQAVALVDSCSTNSFSDSKLAVKMECPLSYGPQQTVVVAGGGKLTSEAVVQDLQYTISDISSTTTLEVLQSGSYDLIGTLLQPLLGKKEVQKGNQVGQSGKICWHYNEPWDPGPNQQCKVRNALYTWLMQRDDMNAEVADEEKPLNSTRFVTSPGSSKKAENEENQEKLLLISEYAVHGAVENGYSLQSMPCRKVTVASRGELISNVVIESSLYEIQDRADTTHFRLRASAYEALNEIVRVSNIHEASGIIGQLLQEIMRRLNLTFDFQILSSGDKEKQSDLQALLCGVLQVIIQKLSSSDAKSIIGQTADQLMFLFLRVFACHSSTVHEEAMLAIGALAYATGPDFVKYMPEFFKYLEAGLQNYEEYQVCPISVGVVGDICRALEDKVLTFCDGIMTVLLKDLSNSVLNRSVKPPIFSCFGDIALTIGENFEKDLPYAMPMLQGAAELLGVLDQNDEDMVYLKIQPYQQNALGFRGSLKLRSKYYGSLRILNRVGAVAYKLQLPVDSAIHPVFHVIQLKKHVGLKAIPLPGVPLVDGEGRMKVESIAVLDRRLVTWRGVAVTEWLVQWLNLSEEDATWEDASFIHSFFSTLYRLRTSWISGGGIVRKCLQENEEQGKLR